MTDAEGRFESTQVVPRAARRGLRAIVGANALSTLGDGAFIAAAPLAAAAITRDPAAVALVLAAETLPWVLVAPVAGVYVDRWAARSIMIVSDVLRAVTVTILAVMVVRQVVSIPAIAVCAFILMAGTVFHSAAAESAIADLAARDPYTLDKVNGVLQSTTTAGRQMLGPPAGSWSWSIAGWLPFAANAFSFALSALAIIIVPRSRPRAVIKNGLWQSMREGARFLLGHRQLRVLALLTGAANLAFNAAMATFVLYATDTHGLGMKVAEYGLLLAAMSVGGFLGGIASPQLLRWSSNWVVFFVGMMGEALSWLVLMLTHNRLVAGFALVCIGFAIATRSVIIMGARQRWVPPELLGRVISAYRVIGNGAAPLGAIIGGLIAHEFGLRASIMFASMVLLIAAAAAGRSVWSTYDEIP